MDRMLDELDEALLHALQLTPRASWSTLARILRTDPSTLSRRWSRLTSEGLAWTSCYLLPERIQAYTAAGSRLRSSFSAIEIRCIAGRRDEVARTLELEPAVVNIECTSGERELTISVAAQTPAALDEYITEHVAPLPGVVSTSTRIIRTVYREGSEWELNALQPAQRRAIEATQADVAGLSPAPPSPLAEAVIRSLQEDARRPASDVAREAGISLPLARRTIAALSRSDWVRMRADFAHSLLGWNATVHLWMSLPQDRMEALAEHLDRHPATRLCASALGPDNFVAILWMRELDELDDIENGIRRLFPEAVINDRWMVPRFVKRMGTLFDRDGRRKGFVPVPVPRVDV